MKIDFTGKITDDTTKDVVMEALEDEGVSLAEFETITRMTIQQELQKIMGNQKVVLPTLAISFDDDIA